MLRRLVQRSLFLLLLLATWVAGVAQNDYFFSKSESFDPKVPTPEQFLGYPIGSHYTRHDQLIAYLRELARVSDKVHYQVIGKTYELRDQVIVTITAPENYAKLEAIRQEHANQVDPSKPALPADAPAIVLLGYSVHGNETSSGEAALLTAYYLAAGQSATTQKWLKESVVFIDPSLNPDGRDRAANWHNSYKSFPNTADPADKEHIEGWPNGRSNHYLSNLNRDWLSATQVESQNRLVFFHQWYPNVHIDFHEMGGNSTYYFEPSPKRTQSPIVPQASYDFNTTLAKYHAAALDQIGSLYFTKEQFDNLSPIYGSTYPDFYGAVGITFEQGSSRGLEQETETGVLTFPFTIRNHVTTGLATVKAAVEEKKGLFNLQKEFFKTAQEQGRAYPYKAFVFGDSRDQSLTRSFLDLLLKHHVHVYELSGDVAQEGKKFEKGKAYVVPADQPNFRIVHSLFEETAKLNDSLYYDNTSWSLIHAYGLQYARLTAAPATRGAAVTAVPVVKGEVKGGAAGYAYLVNWSEYNASRVLFYLQNKGVVVKAAFKPVTITTTTGVREFSYGSLIIPVAAQRVLPDSLYAYVKQAAEKAGVDVYGAAGGFSTEGIDLGSNNIKVVQKPSVAVIAGTGTNFEEVGQVWFLLNQHLGLAVTKLDVASIGRANLNRYNNIVLVSGNYNGVDKAVVARLKNWVEEGGTLIAFKNAADWAIQQELIKEKLFIDSSALKGSNERIDYVQQEVTEAARRINGGIFTGDIDISNPIAFGLTSRKIFFTKNSQTILQPSRNKYATIAKYTPESYVGGYVSKKNIARINNTAAILVSQAGGGKVISFADDPTYRSYWHGTDRLLLNALFFGSNIQLGSGLNFGEEHEE
ncbi:M14 family zinc carboxypeptidase [Paraflavitalea sp. CAU 1676]|uniref:M14 family zinc carboxypeptidase n=1 Tax=Paraflavitalea sp. CAU 1676 TaxID=3032598 RepID=UPI0023DCC133|nr:M14 family zinc carboxypeptidase [Paraflavitalea sp. CAU 1676]MDF2187957.1 M14 family zinc carboxypeptidase [Paraflavitalea sp. CAU 1676]